jgi:uncharacterized membrane protein YwaF
VIAVVSAGPYWTTVTFAAGGCAALCLEARRRPGRWQVTVAQLTGSVLIGDALLYSTGLAIAGTWSASTSLPLALCNAAVLVAALACWWQVGLLVELTCFWGLAGMLQGVAT